MFGPVGGLVDPEVALWAGSVLEPSILRLLRCFTFVLLRAIVFDQMIPRIARYCTGETVLGIVTCTTE